MKVPLNNVSTVLERLYRENYKIIYKVIRRKYYYLSHEVAEECIQEAFLDFFTKYEDQPGLFSETFPNDSSFRGAWINNSKNIYKNICNKSENFKAIEEKVKIERYGELHDLIFGNNTKGKQITTSSIDANEAHEIRFQKIFCIEKVLLKFTQEDDKSATIFFMREYELMTYDQIALTYEKTTGWARNKVYEAKQTLKENLLEECEDFVEL